MQEDLTGLEPKKVFEFFGELTKIPRGTGNEKKVSDWLVDFAGKRGLLAYQDEAANVTILKPATDGMEDKPNVILQAHMDMVCIADDGVSFDPKKDGIDAYVEDGFVRARGTSLGADDGIGVAMILALLDSSDIAHPMIEAVFTTDEEEGLGGVSAYDCSRLKGTRLINLDSEEEDTIVTGCAGGVRCNLTSKCKNSKTEGNIYEITIGRLAGGHSGTDIDKGRANANVLMGRLLAGAATAAEYSLGSLSGGIKDNAICASASATVVVKKKQGKAFEKFVKVFSNEISKEYAVTDPDLNIKCKDKGKGKLEVISTKDLSRLAALLCVLPNGVQKMSQQTSGMVEASANIGVVNVRPKGFSVTVSLRSGRDMLIDEMIMTVSMIAKAFSADIALTGRYPAWESTSTDLADSAARIYRDMFGKEIKVSGVHAGLECAVLTKKIKDLEAISIGPDMENVHTTGEKLSVQSTERVWKYLKELLKQ